MWLVSTIMGTKLCEAVYEEIFGPLRPRSCAVSADTEPLQPYRLTAHSQLWSDILCFGEPAVITSRIAAVEPVEQRLT